MASFGLGAYDADALSTDHWAAELFEATVTAGADAKKAANWIENDCARLRGDTDPPITGAILAQLIDLVDDGTISNASGREVLEQVSATGKSPRTVVDELGLAQVSDSSALEQAVRDVLAANPAAVADYQSGKVTAINFLKGQVMKSTHGKANQAVVEDLLKQNLAQ